MKLPGHHSRHQARRLRLAHKLFFVFAWFARLADRLRSTRGFSCAGG